MKKFLALALVLVFALSLCACGDNTTSNDASVNNNSGDSFVGTWKFDSAEAGADVPEGTDATLQVKADGTFDLITVMSQSGLTMDNTISGVYSLNGSDVTLTAKSATTNMNGQTSTTSEIPADEANLSGTLSGDKLDLSTKSGRVTFKKQ